MSYIVKCLTCYATLYLSILSKYFASNILLRSGHTIKIPLYETTIKNCFLILHQRCVLCLCETKQSTTAAFKYFGWSKQKCLYHREDRE